MEVEKAPEPSSHSPTKRRPKCTCLCCLAVALIVLILLAVLIIILAFTVFKAKKPTMKFSDMSLEDLRFSMSPVTMKVAINLTIGFDVAIHNPNKVGMRYKQGTSEMFYRGIKVGDSLIPSGRVGSNGNQQFHTNVTVMADRLISNSNLYSDVILGTLKFNTVTKLKGKVTVLSVFKVRVATSTTCDVDIHLLQQKIDHTCNYKTSL